LYNVYYLYNNYEKKGEKKLTSIELSTWNVYIGLAISGIFSGLGTALGIYFAQRHFIKRGEKLMKRIKRMFK